MRFTLFSICLFFNVTAYGSPTLDAVRTVAYYHHSGKQAADEFVRKAYQDATREIFMQHAALRSKIKYLTQTDRPVYSSRKFEEVNRELDRDVFRVFEDSNKLIEATAGLPVTSGLERLRMIYLQQSLRTLRTLRRPDDLVEVRASRLPWKRATFDKRLMSLNRLMTFFSRVQFMVSTPDFVAFEVTELPKLEELGRLIEKEISNQVDCQTALKG